MRHHLALVACIAFAGSLAHAAPRRQPGRHGKVGKKAKHHAKASLPAEQPDPSDEARSDDENTAADDESDRRPKRSKARRKAKRDSDRVAFGSDAIDEDVVVEDNAADESDRRPKRPEHDGATVKAREKADGD